MFNNTFKRELKNGNPEAYRELFRLLYPRLKGYCKLFVADDSEMEDIIQDSFIVFWEKRSTIDIRQKIESYIFVIVRNRCLNYLKNRKLESKHIPYEQLHATELQHLYQIDLLEKEEISLEESLSKLLHELVNELPPRMQDVFIKCKLEGKKQEDVAKELGISLKMVEKHIANAKRLIHDRLTDQYPIMTVMFITFYFTLF